MKILDICIRYDILAQLTFIVTLDIGDKGIGIVVWNAERIIKIVRGPKLRRAKRLRLSLKESKENVPVISVIEEVDEEAKKQVAKMEFREDGMNSVQDTCNKLNAVAISKLHVVDTVRDQFVSAQFPLVYASALT